MRSSYAEIVLRLHLPPLAPRLAFNFVTNLQYLRLLVVGTQRPDLGEQFLCQAMRAWKRLHRHLPRSKVHEKAPHHIHERSEGTSTINVRKTHRRVTALIPAAHPIILLLRMPLVLVRDLALPTGASEQEDVASLL